MNKTILTEFESPEGRKRIRNFGTAGHVDHGKTTLSDNFMSAAGLLSERVAGKQLALDSDEQERARGITIKSATCSMVYAKDGVNYLLNLIDTPGHVDFSMEVIRAMRVIDGVIILMCAVEGIKPQTRTVLKQALSERVRIIWFLNKLDRPIVSQGLGLPELMDSLKRHEIAINNLVRELNPDHDRVYSFQSGNIIMGSAYYNWGISIENFRKNRIPFSEIYNIIKTDQTRMKEEYPLHEALGQAMISQFPDPLSHQGYRIDHIWRGENESYRADMLRLDSENKIFYVMKILTDRFNKGMAIGKVMSGNIRKGDTLYLGENPYKVQKVGYFIGKTFHQVDELGTGMIGGVFGITEAYSGVTLSSILDFTPFEDLQQFTEPVVTVSLLPKSLSDMSKLVKSLTMLSKADPSLRVRRDEKTGENLLSGMGELQLDTILTSIENDDGIPLIRSDPIVLYRERIIEDTEKPEIAKSPNKHNRFWTTGHRMDDQTRIYFNRLNHHGRFRRNRSAIEEIIQNTSISRTEARRIVAIFGTNLLIDVTIGAQLLTEVTEDMIEGFREAVARGPMIEEEVEGYILKLHKVQIHVDPVHRGPAQICPLTRRAVHGTMRLGGIMIYEPYIRITLETPEEHVSPLMVLFQQRKGDLVDMVVEGTSTILIFRLSVNSGFGISEDIRSLTHGGVSFSIEVEGYSELQRDLVQVLETVGKRKGRTFTQKLDPYELLDKA